MLLHTHIQLVVFTDVYRVHCTVNVYLQIMALDDSKVKLEQVNDSLSTQVQYKEDLNTVRDYNNNNNK